MLTTRLSLGTLTLALLCAGTAQAEDVTASIRQTVKTNSGQTTNIYMWGGQSFDVSTYRLTTDQVETSLRRNALQIDTANLTATTTQTYTGTSAQISIPDRAGVYLYVAKNLTRTQGQVVVVSDLSLAVKRDNDSSLILLNRGTRPVSSARIKVYETVDHQSAATQLRSYRMRNGVVYLRTNSVKTLTYIASANGQLAIQTSWDRTWQANQTTFQGHLSTDRPLYRPGHTVHYKLVLRDKAGATHTTPVDEEVRLFLRDASGNRTRIALEKTNAFGTVSGSTVIGENAGLGNYTLEAEAGRAASANQSTVVGRASFGVEAYRKPEYKVTVKAARDSYVMGQNINAEIQADYFFGAPVENARVEYTVKKTGRWRFWHPWISPIAMRAVDTSFWWPRWNDEIVARGNGTTDSAGKLAIQFQSTRGDWDADYSVTAKVVDASNREVAGSTSFPVTRASVDLRLMTDRYVYQPNDLVRLRANSAKINGEAAPSVAVEFKIEALKPDGTKEHRLTINRTTDAAGTAGLLLRATNQNRYVVTATATDADGNTVTDSQTIWVEDRQGQTDWSYDGLELTPDKDVYNVGDTALLLVRAPTLTGRGLVTIEGKDIQRAFFFQIVGGIGLIDLTVTQAMVPNAHVSITVPGRDGGFRTISKELIVPAIDNTVEVTVEADKAEYQPGDQATFRIVAKDKDGNPVQAELALGIVDEALFALKEDATEDMLATFFPKGYSRVDTIGAIGSGGFRGGIGGPFLPFARSTLETAAAPDAAQDDGGVREYFPDTMRWIAHIVTDARGEATVTQTIADSLTTWRLTTRAVTAGIKVGETTTTALVRKDLIVRLAAPRTLVEGDVFELKAIVHNLAKAGTPGADNANVRLALNATGVTVLGAASRNLTVDRNDHGSVTFRVRVDEAKEATLTLSGDAGFERDALRLTLPVAVRGVPMPQVDAGTMLQNGDVIVRLDKHADAIDGGSELNVSLSPSLSGTLLDSLDYLVGYPYGCVEQTMSRFLPTLVVAETLRTLGREDRVLSETVPGAVKKGIELLTGHQNADGGFGWFGGHGTSHPYVSAYVTYGLAIAKNQGYDVPDALWNSAVRFLQASLNDASNTDLSGRAYQVFALATGGVIETAEMTSLAGQRSRLDNYAKAVLTLALKKANSSLVGDLSADLISSAVTTSGRTHWAGNTLRYGNWTSNAVEATAYAVRALVETNPNSQLIPQAMSWLLTRRRANGQYTTTKDTAAVVLTFANYVLITNELSPNLSVDVTINGRPAGQVHFDQSSLGKKPHMITIPAGQLRAGENRIQISRQGTGALYYSAVLDQHVRMNPIAAAQNGVQVERKYFVVTERIENGQLIEDEAELTGAARVKLGDRVRVKLTMNVIHQGDVEHVNLEDRFPVGFEVVQEERRNVGWWSWWRTSKEIHDDKVVFFATTLSWRIPMNGPQSYTYQYDMRAESTGDFLALPAFAEAVYAPETNGRTAATPFTVTAN